METGRLLPIPDCTAVILAGGKGRRMKREKLYLNVKNTTLFDLTVSQAEMLFHKLLISVSSSSRISNDRWPIVTDIVEGKGPLAGILTGLNHSGTEKNFITAADIPEWPSGLIRLMYKYTDLYDIVLPGSDPEKIEPLFGFYKKAVIPVIEENLRNGKYKILELTVRCRTKIVPMELNGRYFNINTEDDYRDYLAFLGKAEKDQ